MKSFIIFIFYQIFFMWSSKGGGHGGAFRNDEEIRNAYVILVGKSEGKRVLGRPRYRPQDNNSMYFNEIGWEIGEWIHLLKIGAVGGGGL
jgi:hypothetical protein